MKIAIPTNDDKGNEAHIAEHFGRCETYTILDQEGSVLEILTNKSSHQGGEILPPDFLKQNNIQVLLCHGIGRKALQLCDENSIELYVDTTSTTVQEIFNKWKNQKLSKAILEDSCKEGRSC